MEFAIEVKDLHKSYRNLHVLKGVNLKIKKGSIFALLGTNGSGKTTLVKTLTTLLKPDSGKAIVNGYNVVLNPNEAKQSISLTSQTATIDEILSGYENMLLIAKLRHVKNPKLVSMELLKRFGLTDAAKRQSSTYSGGMRRRLDIAMSLIGNPSVIFLDEPTTGLDPEVRIEVWKIIKELANSGTTIFLTTQYLEEAEQTADQIAILHNGTILVDGTIQELKKQFPLAKTEYIEKQATLEEIFLTITNSKNKN